MLTPSSINWFGRLRIGAATTSAGVTSESWLTVEPFFSFYEEPLRQAGAF